MVSLTMDADIPRKIEISHRTVVFTVVFLGFVWFLYLVRDILFQVFLALLIMTILNPTVTRLQRFKIPRALSVIILYVVVIALVSFSIAQIVPVMIEQTTRFFETFTTQYLQEAYVPEQIISQIEADLQARISEITSESLRIGVGIFSNIIGVLTVLVFALYFLVARDKLDDHLGVLLRDERKQKRVEKVINALERKMGGWVRAELSLMIIVGVSTYVGLTALNIPFALPLAIIAGIFELVPNIGPIIAAVPAIIVGLGISPFTGLAVAALTFLIQQLEAYLIVPKVMQSSVGVSPVVTLLALVTGLKLAGATGALVSVPVVITLQVLLEEFVFKKEST